MFWMLLLWLALAYRAQGYAVGDGTALVFDDSTQVVLSGSDAPPMGSFELVFPDPKDIDAFTEVQITSSLRLKPEFFDWLCPTHCNGLNASAYLALAASDQWQDCDGDSLVSGPEGGSTLTFAQLKQLPGGTNYFRERCMFWHVNIHSCPTILKTGEAKFCTPYISSTLATHTPAQSKVGRYDMEHGGHDIFTQDTFKVKVDAVEDSETSYTTIAHYKFGAGSTVSIAAGWAHKIYAFAQKTACPTGYVPNPDGSCAVCGAGRYAVPPALEVPYYADHRDSLTTAKLFVNNNTWSMSSFADARYCAPCQRGTYWPEASNAADMATDKCIQCPAGTRGTHTGSLSCAPCGPGEYQDTLGQEACFQCSAGLYQPNNGSSSCIRAPNGAYVSSRGADGFERCPHSSMTTNGEGSTDISECSCALNQYMAGLPHPLAPTGTHCEKCPEGFTCDGGRVQTPDGRWRQRMPLLLEGHYATEERPLEAFNCRSTQRCPGGSEPAFSYNLNDPSVPYPMCSEGRTGISCAQCADGMKPSGGKCEPCADGGGDTIAFVIVCILLVVALVGMYISYDLKGRRLPVAHAMLLCVLVASMLFTMMQQLSVVSMFKNVSWDEPMKSAFKLVSFLTFDLDVLNISCVIGTSALINFGAKFVFIACLMLVVIITHVVAVAASRMLRTKKAPQSSTLIGTVGTIFLAVYLAIVSTVLGPVQCLKSPNGLSTVIQFPSVVCWDGGDHQVMTMLSLVMVNMPIMFLAFCGWATWTFPSVVKRGQVSHLKAFNFLFYRFKPDTYWYAAVNMSISFCLGLVPILPDVQLQVILMQAVLFVQLQTVVINRPWKVPVANRVDGFFLTAIIFVLSCAAGHAPPASGEMLSVIAFLFIMACVVMLPCVLALLIAHMWKQRGMREFEFFLCHHKASAGAFARLLKLELQDDKAVKGKVFIDSDNLTDLESLFDQVSNSVSNLVMIGTREILLRPWCMGEITTARMKNVRYIKLALPDYQEPDEAFIEMYEANVDMSVLTKFGISLNDVHETMRWVRGQVYIEVPHLLCDTVLASLSEAVVEASCRMAVSVDVDRVASVAATLSVASEPGQSSETEHAILCDTDDSEATSTALVLQRMLRTHFSHNHSEIPILCMSDRLPTTTSGVLLVCTQGAMEDRRILNCLAAATDEGVKVLPIVVDDRFKFPASKAAIAKHLCDLGEVAAADGAGRILGIFQVIAINFFANKSSELSLKDTAQDIASRLVDMKLSPRGTKKAHVNLRRSSTSKFEARLSRMTTLSFESNWSMRTDESGLVQAAGGDTEPPSEPTTGPVAKTAKVSALPAADQLLIEIEEDDSGR